MTDFPTLLYTLTCKMPYPFIYSKYPLRAEPSLIVPPPLPRGAEITNIVKSTSRSLMVVCLLMDLQMFNVQLQRYFDSVRASLETASFTRLNYTLL